MTTLIAGLLSLDSELRAPTVLDDMVAAMAPWADAPERGQQGPFSYAIASRTHARPSNGSAGQILLADADMAWWHDAEGPDDTRVDAPELCTALSHDPNSTCAQLDGEYALAFWDPGAGSLRLARDGVGVRPIYYVHEPGRFVAFASLLPGLIAAGLIDHEINRNVVAKLATGNFAHGTETQFTRIHRVMPGQSVTFSAGGAETLTHWRLECRDAFHPSANRDEVMATLAEKIERAVGRRLPRTGPLLSHLSGGLDSSAIAALAARNAAPDNRRIRAYAFGGRPLPDGVPRVDEWPALQAVLDAYPNIDLIEVCSPEHDMAANASVSPYFPTFDDSQDLYEQLVRDAAEQGATSILAGFGGDEVVSYAGTGAFAELFVRGRFAALWRISRSVARRSGRPALRMVASELQRFVLPRFLPWMRGHALGRSSAGVQGLNAYLLPKFRHLAHQDNPELKPDTGWLRSQRIHFGHTFWVQEQAAHVSGLHGLRYASPLLDRDVIEFAIRLPPEFLHKDGLMRGGLREPMKGILPDTARVRRTKLHYDPADSIFFSRARAKLISRIEELRKSVAAEMFDLSRLERDLATIPEVEDVETAVKAAAEAGKQHFLAQATLAQPLLIARFLESSERMLSVQKHKLTNKP
ncbi:MAG: asparagine synthase-related protein [Pseudomonadota bacterium]